MYALFEGGPRRKIEGGVCVGGASTYNNSGDVCTYRKDCGSYNCEGSVSAVNCFPSIFP
jgi:hypothetical protein